MTELRDIEIKITDTSGATMALTIPWDDNIEAWEHHLKTIMTYLQFYVDKVEINPESDEGKGDE